MNDDFNLIELLTTERQKGIIIWVLNIGAEKYWHKVNRGIINKDEEIIVNRIEEMNLLLCREQDYIILRDEPDNSYIDCLREAGFSIPNILVVNNSDELTPISELVLRDGYILSKLKELSEKNKEVYFIPYAITAVEEQIAKICGIIIPSSNSRVNSEINDKIFNRTLAEKLGFVTCSGRVCENAEEISREFCRLTQMPPYFKKIIIKERYGASGKGLYLVDNENKLKIILRSLERIKKKEPLSQWLVEGWYSKKADINYQIYISPNGKVNVFSIKHQLLGETVYLGSKMPVELNNEIKNRYEEIGQKIGKALYSKGFYGVAGIDSIIVDDNTIIPIIEVNGRFTLSTYISFLENVFGPVKFLCRYYRVISNECYNYWKIYSILKEEGIDYKKRNNEGVLLYVSGTLPSKKSNETELYLGRVFTIIVSRDWISLDKYLNKLDRIIERINRKEGEEFE